MRRPPRWSRPSATPTRRIRRTDFSAIVDWGDGTTEVGTVTGANGSFAVAVPDTTHFYADEGNDPITVTITGTAGGNIAPTNLQVLPGDRWPQRWLDRRSPRGLVRRLELRHWGAGCGGSGQGDVLAAHRHTAVDRLDWPLADLAKGNGITSVRLKGVTNGAPQAVYDLTLGNVTVSNYADASGGDKLSFNYQQVALTTTAINPDGSLGASQTFSWDRAQHRPAVPYRRRRRALPLPTTLRPAICTISWRSTGWTATRRMWRTWAGSTSPAMTSARWSRPLGGGRRSRRWTVTFASTGLTDILAALANGNLINSVRLEGVTNTGQAVYDLTLGNVSANNYADAATGAQAQLQLPASGS